MTPKPSSEAMLMIEPPVRLAAMRRAASWPTRNTPSRLTAITARHSSSVVLVKKAPEGTPALLTRMVIGPSAASASAKACATEARSVTSMATAAAWPPLPRISAASCSSTSSRRAASATLAPAPASTRAKCRPKPEEAPVTSAVLPASEKQLRRPSPVAVLRHSFPAPGPGSRACRAPRRCGAGCRRRWRRERRNSAARSAADRAGL